MSAGESRTTEGRGRLYDGVIETVGDTPCIRVNAIAPSGVTIYVKAEFFNPAASVKDRLAVSIIEEAEQSGALKPGQTVVEATSGNTGIGLAMVWLEVQHQTIPKLRLQTLQKLPGAVGGAWIQYPQLDVDFLFQDRPHRFLQELHLLEARHHDRNLWSIRHR